MKNKSLALFIDAENIPEKYAEVIYESALKYGNIVIKRVYADWSKENVKGWKEQIARYALLAIQQFNFAASKNSSDMRLLTDALSIFYEKDIDIFVIVSSDSDFTTLVQKLRENKKQVVGMGRTSSVKSYINSFDEFIYLCESEEKTKSTQTTKEHLQGLNEIIKKLTDSKEQVFYSQISSEFKKKYSGFSVKHYGYKNFKTLIRELILPKNNQLKEEHNKNSYYLVKK